MKKEGELRNQLKAVRIRLGMSQQDLAALAGIARQTIGGIEAGTYALSLTVALHLAKALGCSVEDLFWLEGDLPTIEATVTGEISRHDAGESVRVSLGQVGGHWVASELVGDQAFRREMIPADGVGTWNSEKNALSVQLLDTPDALSQTVLLAGCAPALSLWTRSAERWYPGLRVHWSYANSTLSLERLARSEVHIAGLHLLDGKTGEQNIPFVRHAMQGVPVVLVNLGIWEEGLLVSSGNPKQIHGLKELTKDGVVLVNREEGAGSRLLLDSSLSEEGLDPQQVAGYHNTVFGHLDVAEAIQSGRADVGVSTASVAKTYGLSFVPLRSVRYDLAMRKDSLELPSVQQLLGTLNHRWVRSQLAVLGGYDVTRTGELIELA
ncbi:MAG: helix-turn-helix domain-containing protein [Akkermansiaceae bacterium]|nr:helix-turn-helix domain-containing protein [Armatimonadota bacterium]